MRIDAVVRELEIIGEASRNVSEQGKKKYPKIPWKKAIEMRNIIVHEYFGVDEKIVWDTCVNDIPEFKKMIKKIKFISLIEREAVH